VVIRVLMVTILFLPETAYLSLGLVLNMFLTKP
jgi:hypothetical protein